ncbi:hypothetical protein CUMW_200520 [Citrus unshiu]|uniref:Uncharacterized protein n=1 Tax=Citrus unshiu TaxID=55188 RepID=A0A2H5Q6L5_CITUN|nr:hypothetical protein CUMW_200520 [Citrus unshiu]
MAYQMIILVFWQRSLEQLWFHLNIVTIGRAHHLNHYRQKI